MWCSGIGAVCLAVREKAHIFKCDSWSYHIHGVHFSFYLQDQANLFTKLAIKILYASHLDGSLWLETVSNKRAHTHMNLLILLNHFRRSTNFRKMRFVEAIAASTFLLFLVIDWPVMMANLTTFSYFIIHIYFQPNGYCTGLCKAMGRRGERDHLVRSHLCLIYILVIRHVCQFDNRFS